MWNNIANRFWVCDKISSLLSKRKTEGFEVNLEIDKSDRIARMMAFYGYTLVESIEIYWNERTYEELENIDDIVKELTIIINNLLREKGAVKTK